MKKLLQSLLLSIFLITSLGSTLDAGIVKNTAKAGAVYGVSKVASNVVKKNKDKIFTKKKVNDRTAYQRKIDNEVKTKDGSTVNNQERMKQGLAPYVEKNGKLEKVELHHSRQNNNGSLFELTESTHRKTKTGQGAEALHPYKTAKGREANGADYSKTGAEHPYNPVDRKEFNKERMEYWKERGSE